MNRNRLSMALTGLLLMHSLVVVSSMRADEPSRPIPLIFETDMGNDCDDGLTTFEESAEGRDRYLILREDQKGRATEALVQLSSQPPAGFTEESGK